MHINNFTTAGLSSGWQILNVSEKLSGTHKSSYRHGGRKRPPDDSLVSINPRTLKNNCFLLLKIVTHLIMMLSYCLGLTHQQHAELRLAAFSNDQGLFTLSPSKGTYHLLPLYLQTTRKHIPFLKKKRPQKPTHSPQALYSLHLTTLSLDPSMWGSSSLCSVVCRCHGDHLPGWC